MSFGFLRRLRGPLLGAAAASLVFVTAGAVAGSGVNGIFNLGVANTVDAQSSLSGTVGGASQLRVDNAAPNASSFGILSRATSTTGGANSAGLRGVNFATGPEGFGVVGEHKGSGVGVAGQASAGTGVLGTHTAATGTNAGVEGDTSSQTTAAAGVLGVSSSDANGTAGVRGVTGGGGDGVLGVATASFGTGVHGIAASIGAGVFGQAGADGVGVSGLAATGVFGQSSDSSTGGVGVRGSTTTSAGSNATGVLGEQLSTTSGVNSAGVTGFNSGNGFGVLGRVSNSTGAAISANQNSNGIGLQAHSDGGIAGSFDSSGANAVEGTTHETDAIGLLGVSLAGSLGVGVEGSSTSGTGGKFFGLVTGVFGSVNGGGSVGVSGDSVGTNGIGVEGTANTGASAIGVHGRSTGGLAGKFDGSVRVTGKITKDYKVGSTPSLAIPIAYGSVKADGTLLSGTPNVTTALSGTSYQITIASETYTNAGYVTVVTPNGNAAFGKTGANNGKLVAALFNVSGSQIATSGFSFITYKP